MYGVKTKQEYRAKMAATMRSRGRTHFHRRYLRRPLEADSVDLHCGRQPDGEYTILVGRANEDDTVDDCNRTTCEVTSSCETPRRNNPEDAELGLVGERCAEQPCSKRLPGSLLKALRERECK